MNKIEKKERFKSILLVVLFLSAVLLSYFYFLNISFSGIREKVNDSLSGTSAFIDTDTPELSSFIRPDSIEINFGDGTFSVYQGKIADRWKEFTDYYNNFSVMKNILIEEISKEQWDETMYMKSIKYIFENPLPVSLLEVSGASNFGQSDYFDSVSVIAYSEASPSSLFVYDEKADQYFRIISDITSDIISKQIDSFSSNESGQYYPINMYLGTENTALVPYKTVFSLQKTDINTGGTDVTETYEKEIASAFFGESLDFVRKITDDDNTIIYMYRYGQKMLRIYDNGQIEYQEAASDYDNACDFNEAFNLAVSFISSHGSWSSADGNKLESKLYSATADESGEIPIYSFIFKIYPDNYPVYCMDSDSLEIKISGEQILYYKRNFNTVVPDMSEEGAPVMPGASVSEILSYNCDNIADTLYNANLLEYNNSEMDTFDYVVSKIKSVKTGYYFENKENKTLRPVWSISFSGIELFYDLYSGEYLGSEKRR